MERFEALEADFARYYGVDLRAACWGDHPVGMRRLRALIRGLPLDSALGRSVAPHRLEWSTTEELLATLIEVTDAGNVMFFAAHSKPGTPRPRPIRVPRPGQPDGNGAEPARRRRRPATADDMRRFFGGAVRYTPRSD